MLSDKERVQRMKNQNWKPAATYWKELFETEKAKNAALQEEVEALRGKVDQ